MQWYHEVLILMAAIAIILAWRLPWAVIIVGCGSLFYAVTSWWHNGGLPHPVVFGALTNLVMCIGMSMIEREGRSKLIDRLFSCYIMMLLIDLLFVTNVIETQYIFAVSLEVVNAYALLLIWVAGITERLSHGHHFDSSRGWLLDYLNRSLLSQSKPYPQWWRHP